MFSTLTKSALTKNTFCFLVLVCASYSSHAQVVQNKHWEIRIGSTTESYSVVSLDADGIILYRSFVGTKGNQLEITRLDTALQVIWKGFLTVPVELSVVSAKKVDDKIYFFLHGKAPGSRAFQVYAVQIKNGNYNSYPIRNLVYFNATDFVANKNALLIGGYFNLRPLVLFYSIKNHTSRILPGFLNEPGEITQINATDDGDIDVIVSAKNSSKKKCLWLRHFNETGDLIKTVVLEPRENKNLIFGRAAKASDNNQVIAGVYGKGAQYSRGIFVAEVDSLGEYVIHYYNFADLHNFFNYMKARREKRVKERIERRRIKGKKTKFNYRFLVQELIPYGDQFIMVGEAFYPTYTTRYSGYNYPNSQLSGSSSQWVYPRNFNYNSYNSGLVFDGFQYTHAIVLGFDTNAKVTWDNSFETNGLKSYQLEQLVKVLPGKDKIALLYLYDNVIRSKIINNNQMTEGTTKDPIITGTQPGFPENKVESSKLEYWYGNHLFVYGVQEVMDNNDNSHKVFFINKLSAP